MDYLLKRQKDKTKDSEYYNLSIEFFVMYSTFEFALKFLGYLKTDKGYPEADWKKYAREEPIQNYRRNYKNEKLEKAVEYYLTNPPKKQVANKNGGLRWKEHKNISNNDSEVLFDYLAKVRNNLFHGGKNLHNEEELKRDCKLIKNGIVIMESCLAVSNDIRYIFEEY